MSATADDRTGVARSAEPTNAGEISQQPVASAHSWMGSRDRAGSLVALLAFGGVVLLIASEFTDRIEGLEGNVGMGAVNLILASLLAWLVVCTAALIGDSALARAEQRLGRRPGGGLVTPVLTVIGATGVCGIAIYHLRHAPGLDSWIGISGGVLLLLAAVAHRHYLRTPHGDPRER